MIRACAFCVALWAAPVAAQYAVEEETVYYSVSGSSVLELRAEMKAGGPYGWWGYTRWSVDWDADCNVKLRVSITLPRHTDPNSMPLNVRSRWNVMLSGLTAHEKQHARHGHRAAEQIARQECKGAYSTILKWRFQDRLFDWKTDHGALDGVSF